ncbi:MAG TPA: class I SAM-dependent RNA methyltransferase [Spirochaetota bacterium]|nr:class I SAM-dependent RNA methyltransferase [Spirochaetota bacterium]
MTQPADMIEIRLERPLYGGYCLGRHQGKAVMVPYAIPGETVAASITEDRKDFCFASITAIMEADPRRSRPDCPHFTRCGGCSYLHVPYEEELEFKKTILEDSLARIAGFSRGDVPKISVIQGDRHGYRSHATIKVRGGLPGFYRKGSNDFVQVGEGGCLLLAEPLNQWMRNNVSIPGDCRIALDASSNVISSFHADAIVVDNAGGLEYARGISSFFQANRLLRNRMLETVIQYAGLGGNGTFLDIGCGVGFFSLALAGYAVSGTGIDISGENIRWARHNAALNGIENVMFMAMPSNRIHPVRQRADVVVADPPRAGLDKKTRKTILALGSPVLVYVSCNPATFSRDARDIVNGGYALEQLTMIDMFPGTHHIELISRFSRGQVSPSA